MSILETFYLLFKADTTDLKKGLDKSTKNTEEAVDKIGKKFSSLATKFAGFAAALLSVNAILNGIRNTAAYDINLNRESKITGVRPEDLDVWQNAVVQAGGTAEDFDNALKNVAQTFHTTADVALKAFPMLSDVLNKMGRFGAFNYGKAIGLNESVILLLRRNRQELEAILKRQKELGIVTKQDTDAQAALKQEIDNLGHAFRTFYNSILTPLTPALVKLFQALEDAVIYLSNHRDLVIGALVGMSAAAISAAFAFAPLTLEFVVLGTIVIGLIALFALFWDDYKTYMRGGKSDTREFIKEWEKLDKLINDTLDTWIDKLVKFLNKFSLLKGTANLVESANEARKEGTGLFGTFVRYKLHEAQSKVQESKTAPINNIPSLSKFYSSSFNKNSTINTGDIIVNTQATDAEGIAKQIGLTFSDHFALSANNFADGNKYG